MRGIAAPKPRVDVDATRAPAFCLTDEVPPSSSGWHSHRRHQLLYCARGALHLEVERAQRLLPPQRAACDARMLRAMELLAQEDARVTQTAYAVGFESLGTFTHAFHAFCGERPRDFRQCVARSELPPPQRVGVAEGDVHRGLGGVGLLGERLGHNAVWARGALSRIRQ